MHDTEMANWAFMVSLVVHGIKPVVPIWLIERDLRRIKEPESSMKNLFLSQSTTRTIASRL